MTEAKFILSKKKLKEQVKKLEDLGLKVSYSYKTNREVGKILQDLDCGKNIDFSIHSEDEIGKINDKNKISFFCQAHSKEELNEILGKGVESFVIDNGVDLNRLLKVVGKMDKKINISLRMKFKEHRIGTGKYFVYGMPSRKVNDLIKGLENKEYINNIGIHIHRKSQNTSEWKIVKDLKDSLDEKTVSIVDFINLGGGLPSVYRSSPVRVFDYIFGKLKEARGWMEERDIEAIIEPGRFIAAPAVKLKTEIIQKYGGNLVINATVYNCALDSVLTNTKMLVEGELKKDDKNYENGEEFLIKGNSPTRDDIFRYRVRLNNPKVGDEIVFLNAGAYNYTTDFFGFKKIPTKIRESF